MTSRYAIIAAFASVAVAAASAQTRTSPIRVGGPIAQPTRLVFVPPNVPAGTAGVAILELLVDPSGQVVEARELKPLARGEAAIAAAKKWRYEPVIYDGKPAWALLTATVRLGIPSHTQRTAGLGASGQLRVPYGDLKVSRIQLTVGTAVLDVGNSISAETVLQLMLLESPAQEKPAGKRVTGHLTLEVEPIGTGRHTRRFVVLDDAWVQDSDTLLLYPTRPEFKQALAAIREKLE